MKTLVGLGNPGVEYMLTRHNAGVVLVNALAEKLQSDYGWRRKKNVFVYESNEITLVKSADVFMNESGKMVREVVKGNFMIEDLMIAHDDLDIKLGEYKIVKEKGPKVHGGLLSIERELKTKEFWRIRIGIDNRTLPVNGDEYVLQRFSSEEREMLNEVIEKVVSELNKAW